MLHDALHMYIDVAIMQKTHERGSCYAKNA